MQGKVGVGIIGLDHWYTAIGCIYSAVVNPNAELLAISDVNEEKVKRISKLYKAKTWCTDYHDILKDPKIDAVVIATTADLHGKIAMEAAEAGKDMYVHHPIARTLKEADQVTATIKKTGIRYITVPTDKIFPAGQKVKKMIDEGTIGNLYAAHFVIRHPIVQCEPGPPRPGWFADPKKGVGGALIDTGIYPAGSMLWYFNSDVDRVYAEIGKFAYKDLAVEDHAAATIRFKDGSIAMFEVNWTAPGSAYGYTELIGTKGEIDIVRGRGISIRTEKELTTYETIPLPASRSTTYVELPVPTPPYKGEILDYLVECILEDKEPLPTIEDGRKAMEICLAGYESVRTGKPAKLPLKTEVDVTAILSTIK